MPYDAPAETAPINKVYKQDKYHLTLVTLLFPKPSADKNRTVMEITAISVLRFKSEFPILAAIIGIKGMNPKVLKLIKVIKKFLTGLASEEISFSYSIIIIFRNSSLSWLRIYTISFETYLSNP